MGAGEAPARVERALQRATLSPRDAVALHALSAAGPPLELMAAAVAQPLKHLRTRLGM
jgi:hypothetical protein